jgi:1,2-diacylglycerol 3-beta-galactosyltransferase
VVIAGRNQKLKSNLEAMDWHIPATIYGFVRQMPDFMRASDVLITKAGPGTISEAFIAGLPLILYSRLPGQEEGNVSYTVDEGAGVWAPTPELVVATLHNWLKNPVELEKTAANARRLARPQAAHQIAEILAAKVGVHSSQEQTLLT